MHCDSGYEQSVKILQTEVFSGVERTNFDDMFWTKAKLAFVPEEEGGSSIET